MSIEQDKKVGRSAQDVASLWMARHGMQPVHVHEGNDATIYVMERYEPMEISYGAVKPAGFRMFWLLHTRLKGKESLVARDIQAYANTEQKMRVSCAIEDALSFHETRAKVFETIH